MVIILPCIAGEQVKSLISPFPQRYAECQANEKDFMVANALVGSKLEYCNPLFRSRSAAYFTSRNVFGIALLKIYRESQVFTHNSHKKGPSLVSHSAAVYF